MSGGIVVGHKSVEITAAVEAVDIANGALSDAEDRVEQAKGELSRAAMRYLMEASDEIEQKSRAAYIYWEMPLVPAAVIASVILGNPKAANMLASIVGHVPAVSCRMCNREILVKSRSELARIQSESRRAKKLGYESLFNVCEDCRGMANASRIAGQIEQERRWADRVHALRTMPYRDYLMTEEWLETRNRKLRKARYRCQLCNASGFLNVHHRTYERRGSEDDADLIVLCHPCHAKFHDKVPQE
jgi:5-methylcytosine-specific restriction endonuclease McrA